VRDQQGAIEAAGARIAAVGLGDQRYAQAFRAESGIDFPLLVDERRRAYDAAGLGEASVFDLARPGVLAAGLRAFAAGHRQHRTGPHPMQLGGSFVFGPGNVDHFTHVSADFADNTRAEVLVRVIAGLRS
jgi:hypothetical protein